MYTMGLGGSAINLFLKAPVIGASCVLAGFLYIKDTETKYVSFSFDDGYASDFTLVYPLFTEYNIRGTLFPYLDAINAKNVLTVDSINLLAREGWEIGNHTVTHTDLTALSDEEREFELDYPGIFLKDVKLRGFASPYGAYDKNLLTMVADRGYYHVKAWDKVNDLDALNVLELNRYQLDHLNPNTALEVCDEIKNQDTNKWTIFLAHEVIMSTETPDYKLQYSYLKDLVECLKKDEHIKILPIYEVLIQL